MPPTSALALIFALAGCSADDLPKPACIASAGGSLGVLEPYTLDQELVATIQAPPGEAPGQVTLRASGEGEGTHASNAPPGLDSPYCLTGEVSVQWASAEVDVALPGLEHAFQVPFRSAKLERELHGEGVHVSLSLNWYGEEQLPPDLLPFTRSGLERVYRERPDLVGYEMIRTTVWLKHQQGASKPPLGVFSYDVELVNPEVRRKDQWLDSWVVELVWAKLTPPEP
jgi:hypothetical protein